MLAGLSRREICTWYFMPPRSRYAPSVVPWRVSASLLPHAVTARAAATAATDTSRRRIGRGSLSPGGRTAPVGRGWHPRNGGAGRRLARAAGDRRPRPPPVVLLEDGLQPAHRLAQLALHPPARAEALEEAVGGELRLALEREAHAGAVARRGLELVDA